MKYLIVAVTGTASAGKSSIIKRLAQQLNSDAVPAFTMQETATELLASGFSSTADKKLFQRSLFDFQLSKERIYRAYIASFAKQGGVLLLDRGLLDGGAFIDPEDFSEIIFEYGLTPAAILARYDAVIQLQTSAAVREYEQTDNNAYRVEKSAQECFAQEEKLKTLYKTHPNYFFVKSTESFDEKYRQVLQIVKQLYGS